MKRLLVFPAVAVAAAALGGCNMLPEKRSYFSRAAVIPVVAAPGSDTTGAITRPVVNPAGRHAVLRLPPAAGKIKRVKETHYVNGSRQEIEFESSDTPFGQNVIDVSMRTASPSRRMSNPLEIGPPSRDGIHNEILSRFSRIRMNIVTRPMRNRFGPFGLAIGKGAGGARCVFAWQWVESLQDHATGSTGLSKFSSLVSRKSLATSIRVRLCSKTRTLDQLAAFVRGLNISSHDNLQRIIRMNRRNIDAPVSAPVATSGGKPTSLLQPVGGTLEASLGGSKARSKPVVRKATKRKVTRTRSRPRQQGIPQRAIAATPAIATPPATYGRKYLAPVAGAPAAATAAPRVRSRTNLPPEAFRGPQP